MRNAVFVLVAVTGLWAGCGRRGKEYFPLVARAERVMSVRELVVVGAETTETVRVETVERVRGQEELKGVGRVWVVETPLDSNRVTNYYYLRRGDSVFAVVPARGGRPQRVLYLVQPLRVGLKWYDSDARREVNEVVAEESVSVPAGSFGRCFKLTQRGLRIESQVEKWLAPGVGVVKRVKQLSWVEDSVPRSLYREEQLVEYRVPGRHHR